MTTPPTTRANPTASRLLSARTVAGYAADWALFADWCTATNQNSLPADWVTVAAFNTGCPSAPATIRRRLAAIGHHHRAAGHPAPADPARALPQPSREVVDPGQVDMLMRLLPSHGWLGGLFGRRDRALLTLAAYTQIPYRQLPRLTVGQLQIGGGVATVTDRNGTEHVIESDPDPVLCGPCALVRWRRVLDSEVRHKRLKTLFKDAEEVTSASHHPCHAPKPIDDRTLEAPLFPPINQWGQLPFPLEPLSSHSTSRLARQADTGLAPHRVLDVDEVVRSTGAEQAATEPAPAVARPVYDWDAANQRKKDAVQQLAPLSVALDEIEARIAELIARTKDFEFG